MKSNNVLILIGSPKGRKSASNNIASYLEDRFKINNVETEKIYLVENQNGERLNKVVKKTLNSELVVLIAPLYIDSIPAITIKFMEEYHLQHNLLPKTQQRLLSIFNSGFPEPKQNDVAIDICKNFAHQTGMEWEGGITIGMGAAFQSQSLKNAGGMARNLRKGLDEVIDSLSIDKPVPDKAIVIASKPLAPLFVSKFIMRWFGGFMWKKKVKDKTVQKEMYKRPYEI
ncbi:NAD(P)H-dependent oxidoreductase [Methanobacterium alcaliphilum]|uniref:NAD(P)H-dependent oxidoreductase n=1 Tax=Methanobacterium alcaliphilum TaxID=392018 RepID=UPI00200B5A34|nr:NAD(P)H-dependent oxidoreductase [Methanobacterium alcaliphilum]MCK9151867.1 NAD(P)H-dependent oxidoreductase [Methanobacterium alcaliphilum]